MPQGKPDMPQTDSRPDVITIRFRVHDDGIVTRLIPDEGIEFPFEEPYVQDRAQILAGLQQSVVPFSYDPGLHVSVGHALQDALLLGRLPGSDAPELIRKFVAAKGAARGGPVTFQIAFDEGALGAAQLPWEVMADEDGNHAVAMEVVRLNRYITYFGDREPFEEVDPLRVLYLESRPKDQGKLPDVSGEYRSAVDRLGDRIQTDFVRHATFAEFEAAVSGGAYHVVHYDGHGYFDGAMGYLLFEDGSRNTDWVTAERLTGVLGGSGVRLVVLGACQGSTVGGMGMFQSTAPALIRAGVPAVVANQFSIYVDAEKEFTGEFYASIARGESISAAVADGRRAMAEHRGQFFLPTLYLRIADGEGYLFGGEPETHRRWRMSEMQKLAAWWVGLSQIQRVLYKEGILRWQGSEVQPVELPAVRRYDIFPPATDVRESVAEPHLGQGDFSGTYVASGWWPIGHRLPIQVVVRHEGSTITINGLPTSHGVGLKFEGSFRPHPVGPLLSRFEGMLTTRDIARNSEFTVDGAGFVFHRLGDVSGDLFSGAEADAAEQWPIPMQYLEPSEEADVVLGTRPDSNWSGALENIAGVAGPEGRSSILVHARWVRVAAPDDEPDETAEGEGEVDHSVLLGDYEWTDPADSTRVRVTFDAAEERYVATLIELGALTNQFPFSVGEPYFYVYPSEGPILRTQYNWRYTDNIYPQEWREGTLDLNAWAKPVPGAPFYYQRIE